MPPSTHSPITGQVPQGILVKGVVSGISTITCGDGVGVGRVVEGWEGVGVGETN